MPVKSPILQACETRTIITYFGSDIGNEENIKLYYEETLLFELLLAWLLT